MASRELTIKDRENQLHDMIYKNISVLTLIYPTTAEFKDKFKQGMFKKNNQPGSQQVVYFLLSIIDQEQIQQRITSWPIRDVREESKFRLEIMRFYGHLQEKYDDFGLKTLLSSHLITPGGYKFAKFILKLSDLALFVHLTKDKYIDDILFRPKPSKDADMTSDKLQLLKIATKNVQEDAVRLCEEHESLNREYNSELEAIDNTLLEVKRKIHELNKNAFSLTTTNILEDDFIKSGTDNYENWFKGEIKTRLNKLCEIAGMYKECTEVTQYLLSKDNALFYDKANPITSDLFSNTIECDDKLNLIKFFEIFLKYLQDKLAEINLLPTNFINPQKELLEKINNEHGQVHNEAQILLNNIIKAQYELVSYKISTTVIDI